MNTTSDSRIVMSLDAGGTNFVFTAISSGFEIIKPITLPSYGNILKKCLGTIIDGFRQVRGQLPVAPAAISFAFPGPADYPNGIIGDLGNLPGFRGGIALGPMLEELFQIPVFINNDGDLYAYGEAIGGYLPYINSLLENAESPRQFRNLVGFTLGTGFGAGLVCNGELYLGDNSGAAEVWLMGSRYLPGANVEEGVSIRAVQRVFGELTGLAKDQLPTPKEIFEIASGKIPGNQQAANEAYRQLGRVLGDSLSNILTFTDSIAVIGGGISGAWPLIVPHVMAEMRSAFNNFTGSSYPRLVQKVMNLEDHNELQAFLEGDSRVITVPRTGRQMVYDPMSRLGIGLSKIGTSRAITLGAYNFAIRKLDQANH